MKKKRHDKILEIIKEYEIDTQGDLAQMLRESGFNVTQATVSRDIRELGLVKVAVAGTGGIVDSRSTTFTFFKDILPVMRVRVRSPEASMDIMS